MVNIHEAIRSLKHEIKPQLGDHWSVQTSVNLPARIRMATLYAVSQTIGGRVAIIFDRWFIAPDELNEFCQSIGYENPDYPNDFDLMFDPRIVQFCQQNLTRLWGEHVYRGRESCDFRCGFAGAGYIRQIDTSKTWRLSYNHVDAPVIDYVQVSTNKYGYLSVL